MTIELSNEELDTLMSAMNFAQVEYSKQERLDRGKRSVLADQFRDLKNNTANLYGKLCGARAREGRS